MATETETPEPISIVKIEEAQELRCSQFDTAVDNSVVAQEIKNVIMNPVIEGKVGISEGGSFLESPSLAKIALEETSQSSEDCEDKEKVIPQMETENATQLLKNEINKSTEVVVDNIVKGDTVDAFSKQVSTDTSFENARTEDEELVKSLELSSEEKNIEECMVEEISSLPMMSSPVDPNLQEGKTTEEGDVMEEKTQIKENISDEKQASIEEYPKEGGILHHHIVENSEEHTLEEICESRSIEEDKVVTNSHEDEIEGKSFAEEIVERTEETIGHIQETLSPTQDLIKQSWQKEESKDKNLDTDEIFVKEVKEISSQEEELECKDEEESFDLVGIEKYPKTIREERDNEKNHGDENSQDSLSISMARMSPTNENGEAMILENEESTNCKIDTPSDATIMEQKDENTKEDDDVKVPEQSSQKDETEVKKQERPMDVVPEEPVKNLEKSFEGETDNNDETLESGIEKDKNPKPVESGEKTESKDVEIPNKQADADDLSITHPLVEKEIHEGNGAPPKDEEHNVETFEVAKSTDPAILEQEKTTDEAATSEMIQTSEMECVKLDKTGELDIEEKLQINATEKTELDTTNKEETSDTYLHRNEIECDDDTIVEKVKADNQIYQTNDADESKREVLTEEVSEGPKIADAGETLSIHEKAESTHDKLDTASVATVTEMTSLHEAGPEVEKLVDASEETIPTEVDASETSLLGHNGEDVKLEEPSNLDESANVEILTTEKSDPDEAAELKYDITVLESDEREIETTTESAITASKIPLDETSEEKLQESLTQVPKEEELKSVDMNEETKDETPMEEEANDENPVAPLVVETKEEISMQDEEPSKLEDAYEKGSEDNGKEDLTEENLQNTEVVEARDEEFLEHSSQEVESKEKNIRLKDTESKVHETAASSEDAEKSTCEEEEGSLKNLDESFKEEIKGSETEHIDDTRANETQRDEVVPFTDLVSTEQKNKEVSDVKPEDDIHEENGACLEEEEEHIVETFEGSKSTETETPELIQTSATECMKVEETCESDSTEKLDIDEKENRKKETENKEETFNTNLDKNELECEDIEEGIVERDVAIKDHNTVTPRDEIADQSSQEDEIEKKTIVEPAPELIQSSLIEDVAITDFSTISEEEKVAKKNSQEDEVCEALETTDADENTEKENIEKDGVVSELSTISVTEETTKERSLEDEKEAKEHGGQAEESNLTSMEMNLEETDSTEDTQALTLEDEEDQRTKPNASCVTESSEEETTQKASLHVDASDFASEDTIPEVIESSETSLQGLDGEGVKLEETSNLDENANEAAELKYDTPMAVPVIIESEDQEIVTTTESGTTASETPLDKELEEKPQESSKLVSKEEELKSVEVNEKEKDDTPMEEETNNDKPETLLVLETEEEPRKLEEDFEMGSEDIGKENPTEEVQKGENPQNIKVIEARDEEVLVHSSQEGESEEKIGRPEDTVFEGHETAASSENVEKSTCEGEQGPLKNLEKSFEEEIKGRDIEHIDDTKENETQRDEVVAFTDQASMEQNLKPVDLGEKIEGLAEESPNKDADDLSLTHPLVEKIMQEVSKKHEEVSGVKAQEDIHEEHGAHPEEKEHNVETFEVSKSTETAILEQEKSTDGNAMECMKIKETGELDLTEKLDIDSDDKREKETENKELTSTIIEGIVEDDVTIKDHDVITPGDETTVQSCREVEIEQKTIQEPELELIGEDQIYDMKEAEDSTMGGIPNEKVCEGPNESGEDEEKQRKEEDFTVKDLSKSFNEEETVKDGCEEDKKEEEKPEQKVSLNECEGLETLGVDECIEKQITQEDEAEKEHSIVPVREETIRESSHEDEKVEDKHKEEVSEGVDVTSAGKNTEEKIIDENDIVKEHNIISSEVKAVEPSCQGDELKANEPKEEVCEEVETIDASEDTEKHIIEDDNAVQAHCTESVQAELVPESPQEDAKDTKKPEGEVSEDIEEGIIEEVVAIKDRDFVTPGDETVGQSCREVDIEKKTIPEPEPELIGEEQIYETNGADDGTMKGILNEEVCEGPTKASLGEDEEKQRKEKELTLKDLSESFRGEETVKDSCEEDKKEVEKPEQKECEGLETVSVDEYIDKQITQEDEAVKEHSTVPVGEETIREISPEDEKVENKHEAEVSDGLEVVSASKNNEEKIIDENDIIKDHNTISSGEEAVKPTCQGDEQKANKLEEEVCETLETTSASEVTEKQIIEDENAIQAHCTIPIREELVPESPQDDAKDAKEPKGEVFEELDTAGLGENSGKQIIEDTDPSTTSIEEEAVKNTSREEEEVHERLEVTGKDDAGERQILEEVTATELHTVSVGEIVKERSLDDKVCESGEGNGNQIIEEGIGTDISMVSVREERTKESSHEEEREAKKHEEEVKESNLISIEREIEAADSTEETETVVSKDEQNPNKSSKQESGEEIIQKENSEKVSETSTLVSEEQIKEEILEKAENTNDMGETVPFEVSGASLKGIDVEDAKLEETTNLDDNSDKEILAAENPNADEAEQEKEYEIPMGASVTVPESVDREIKPTTETMITDSKPQLDDKSEEKLHESSTLEPKEQEIESIEADKMIKDETPNKDEIQDENLDTPLVVETIEEIAMLKEEPGKLEEASEMGSEDIGKESLIPELDTEEHLCESKDSDAILEREFINESKTVTSVPGLENDKLEEEKQIDVPSKELETTGACANTEKDILEQLEDPIKNLDQSFDKSRKEHSEIKDVLVEPEANDEDRSLAQNLETVDQGEEIKSSSESVAQDTCPKTEKIETEEVEETIKGHDMLTVEDQMVGQGSQEEEKASKNLEEAKPKLEAEDQSDTIKCADELSDNIILDEEVPQRVERADESENISVGDEVVKEVKDSDFVYTEKIFEATNLDKNKEMEMLTEEDLNMKPNASLDTEESREEIIKKEERCKELAEVSKSVSEVSEDNIKEEILEETSSQEAKPEVEKIVEASGIVSKEDSSAIVETIETSIKGDEVESVNIGETSNLVSQLPIIENEKSDQEIVTVGKVDADNAETSCAREDTEKNNLEKDEPIWIPEEIELLHDTIEKEENAEAVYASEHIETADVESPEKNTDDSPTKDSLIKEPLVHEVGGKCEEASYSEKLERSLKSFSELEGEENRSVKTNEANETTENDIVPEEASVGLEKASASENIEKQISCEEDENTVKESHEEDEMIGEKAEEEAIKLDSEEQIHELETEEVQREITHEAKEYTKNEILNEEVLENTGASENIEKQITWEEVSDKETYLVSIGEETAQGTAKEALELETEELSPELECEEHPDTKTNETIEKEIVNEEIKSSDEVLVERELELRVFSEKAEIVTIKDEEGPSTDFTAPPAAKEVSAIVVEEPIPETVTENAEKMESATEDTSAPEGLIEVEKLKNTSSELESSSTIGITEDLHIKEEVPSDTLEASSLMEDSQAEVQEKERKITEGEEKHEFVLVNQATADVSPPTEESEGENIKNEAPVEETLEMESKEKLNEANIQDKICGNEDGETQIPKQDETPQNIEKLTKTSDATAEEKSSRETDSTESTETKFSTESIDIQSRSLESFSELEGEENQSVKKNEANEPTENEIVPEEVYVGLEKGSASENTEKQISGEEEAVKDPYQISVGETVKEIHEEGEMKGEEVEEEATKLEPEEQIHELEIKEVQRKITNEAQEDKKNEISIGEVLENTGASENIEKQITWEEGSVKEAYLVSVGEETVQETAKEALELEPKELSPELECEEHPDGKTNETIEKEIVNEEIKSSNQVLAERELETTCFSEKEEIVTSKDEDDPSTNFSAPPATKEVSALVVEEPITETITKNAEKMERATEDKSAPEGLIEVEKFKNTSSELESSSTIGITEDLDIKEEIPTDKLETSLLTEPSQAEVQEKERKIREDEEKHEFVFVNQATTEVSLPTEQRGDNNKNEALVEEILQKDVDEKLNEANIQDKICGNEDGETQIPKQEETPWNIENLKKTSDATTEEQTSSKMDSTESTETKFLTESIPSMTEVPTGVEDQKSGEASGIQSEVKGVDNEPKPSDSDKVSLWNLLERSTKETSKMVGEFTEERNLDTNKEKLENKETPSIQVEEEKTDEEEKDEGGEEEEDEHKKTDSGSDAPVMVEASRDIDVKPAHKKSHNILSGVGSKVKHSIAKVKKAITGKSSHHKPHSPK